MPCSVKGCPERWPHPTGYCERHQRHLDAHGEPQQRPISAGELKPFLAAARARMERYADSDVWSKMGAAWEAVVSVSAEALDYVERERNIVRNPHASNYYAHVEIAKIAATVRPRAVVEVVLAMYLMGRKHQEWFRGEAGAGFVFQLVRRVRALDKVTGRGTQERVRGRRGLSYASTAFIGGSIVRALGGAANRGAALEEQPQ